ncbi:hypothetical protein [Deinococcus geothermalis]|uniref:hypothetical protein n=1 Tax=Deinococcus geothermalis TaxID=68909 RepID=UPI0023523711
MTYSKKRSLLLALAALPLSAGLVFAAGTSSITPQPGQTQGQGRTPYTDVFLQKLAAQLGLSVDRLRAAATSAANATIDQAVRAGDLPQNRAAELKARVQAAPLNFGLGGRPRPERGPAEPGERRPRAGLGRAVTAAVARTLGLSEQALRAQLRSGQTVTQLAQAKGVSTQTVRSAALAALKSELAREVQAGRLTQAQADQRLARAQADTSFGLALGRGGHDGPNAPRGLTPPVNPASSTNRANT